MQRQLVSKTLESERIEVPLAIQTYLWGQTSFFLKPNLHEKKSYGHVCVAFEKIICENRVGDLPPNLSRSMNTIPRWHFVQGALPFVLHCCAALLSNRAVHGNAEERLTVAETKLLYTLHWILIKAPEEVENYSGKLYPLNIVELFVQSVVPYVNCIQPQDLTFRLQEGLELWEALWEFRAPPLKCFTAPVVFEMQDGDKISLTNSTKTGNATESQTTFFDLAVLKCLMLPDWHEEGRVWGLQYVLRYLENEEKILQEQSKKSSLVLTAEVEPETPVSENVPKPVPQATVANVDKLKRFYGLSTSSDVESGSGQKKRNVKDSNRHVSSSSSSSLLDALATLSNLKLPEDKTAIVNGAKELLDENGSLKRTVFLDVVCQIANQSSNARVCDLVLSILEHILEKYISKIWSPEKDGTESASSDKENTETGSPVSKQNTESVVGKFSFLLSFKKALMCITKMVRSLGCSYGCGKGIRGVIGKNLRAKTMAMLSKIHEMDKENFQAILQHYIEDEDVEVVTCFLHALLGFCTMTLESKSNQKKMSDHFREKSGILGIVIDITFAPYVARLLEFNLEEISNVNLYGQVRQLTKYVKEYAGGTFFRVVFRGLLKASGKPYKRVLDPLPKVKPATPVTATDGDTGSLQKTSGIEKVVTPKNQRKNFFSKFSKSVSSPDGSPVGNLEFGFDGQATPLSRRKALKVMKKGSPIEESYSVEDDSSPVGSTDRRRRSLMRKFFKSSTRKKADEIFSFEYRKQGGVSLGSFRQQRCGVEYTSIPVNVQEIRDGMMMFSMLLESSLPGSVPDPNIVAGILELKAPAVARGALLVECSHFVHRCNKGEWPSWLLSSHPSTRRGKGGFGALVRNAIAVSRRNVRIKHEAGLLFYKWAVAIGEKLEQIESRCTEVNKESKDVTDNTKHLEEDFLDEGTLDEETRKCPHALKMVACQLLLEITAFLRESHSSLAKKAENQRMRNKSIAFSRQSRRTTQKVSVFGGEHRDAVMSGPAERLRQGNPSMLSPVMSLLVPTVQIQQGTSSDKKISAPVIKVDGDPPETENEETSKPPRKRFSALFSNSEKKRKLLKPETTERKSSSSSSRIYKKSPKVHKAVGRVTSDASDNSDNEEEEVTKFPWLKAVTVVSGSTNFICDHRDVCASGCIRRQTQSCAKFMSALKTIYSKPVGQLTNNASRKLEGEKGRQCKLSTKELTIKQKEERDKVMITYVSEKVRNLFNCPMSVMIKGAVVMEPSLLLDIIPLAWELLLNPLEELVSTAAAIFLIASLHLKDVVEKMLHKELTCNNCEYQVKSLMRYGVLWRSRYHVWPRMESGAKYVLRIPLPKLDFTLPSPSVGAPAPPVPDCPWDPTASIHITKNELELTEEDKQKDEEEASKVKEEKKKQRTYYNFTNTSVSLEASTPAEPEEGSDVVVQPISTDFWPPAMSSAIPRIIGLLDDSSVTLSQTAVSEVAKSTLWECLVDDPMLFFRTFFEEITKPHKQKELVFLLNKLLVHFTTLPPNAGVILFNHLVGVVLFYSRRSQPCSEDAIALIVSSLLWKIVPSVPKLYLKDLKYSAKKEHCERTLMVTANTPGTKKIVVTSPNPDAKTENEKLTVREDMTFDHILQYCTAKWSLDNPHYRLLDAKSGQILEGKHLVRDIYAFKKGFPYPQLKLQVYKELDAYVKRQEQAFTFKMAEVGRLYLTLGILETVQNWHHVSFLHSELSKQIAFPRKALDVDFGLYEGGFKGKQLCSMDGIHKRMWIKLLSKLFDSMTSSFPWGDNDLHLFLNVINGALLLQCEDSSMLRFCLSTLINAAIKFTDIFAIDGYHHILPTLALLYSHHENNEIVCNAVEFVISQFYILHQKPFLLQLFASIEPILLTENVNKMPEHSDEIDESNMILPKCLFAILSSLEKDVPDSLDILALVEANKPLKPLDSCYEGKLEENECKIDIAIRLCVTVVAFSPESIRATQMLVVLSSILPFYLEYIKNNDGVCDKKKECKDELTALQSLHCSVQVLLKSCNSLRRPFLKMKGLSSAAKRRVREGSTGSGTSFTTSHENVRQSRAYPDDDDRDADSLDQPFKPFLSKFSTQDEGEQVLDSLYEFRTPRNAILVIASEFISTSKKRVQKMNEKNPVQIPNLALDYESIQALCNIAHTLLKLSLTDTVSLELTGLQKFMLEALPNIDWSAEEVLPALNLVLKRINTTFTKITDKPDLMNFFWPYPLLLHRSENWNVTEVLLKGLHLTISKQATVTALPYTKGVVATCMRLVLREQIGESDTDNAFCYYPPPSLTFCQLVVKIAARLMYSLKDKYSLKDLCGGTIEFGNDDRTLRVLVHILLPLCIRLGTGSKDQPRASKEDVSYAVSCFLNIIVTPFVDMSLAARRLSSSIMVTEAINPSSPFVERVLRKRTDAGGFSPSIHNAAYLGLKVMIICFPCYLSSEWRTIASVLKEVVMHGAGNEPLFEFLEFIILHRSPLFLLLLPIIRTKIPHLNPTNARASALKEDLLKRLQTPKDPTPSKEEWMQRFIQDLGVLTGGEQNDMFFCRNPSIIPGANTDVNSVMDVESLSDSESAYLTNVRAGEIRDNHAINTQSVDVHVPESLEVPERSRKLSSSSRDSSDKSVLKSLKKKVSFDKGQSYNPLDESKEETNAERPPPRQKRSLPRQEIAVDFGSPISNKRLSENYPVFGSDRLSDIDCQTMLKVPDDTCGQSQEKKRKVGKYRKFAHESAGVESSQSSDISDFSEISQENVDQCNENVCSNAESNVDAKIKSCSSESGMGTTLTVPNLVINATITENSNISGTNNKVVPSKASCSKSKAGSAAFSELPQVVNKTRSEKLNSEIPNGDEGIPANSVMSGEVMVDNKESTNLFNETSSPDYRDSNDTCTSRNVSKEMLLPVDHNKTKSDRSLKVLEKNDQTSRWSCSALDTSKETSL